MKMIILLAFDPDLWGTVSDWFMVAVTAATLYALYRTIKLQQQEIKDQDKYRKIERETANFFELMNIQDRVLESVTANSGTETARRALKTIAITLKNRLLHEDLSLNKGEYLEHVKTYGENYLHYIRAIQTTFRYVTTSDILPGEQKKTLITIFKSHLSQSELSLWAYHLFLEIHTEGLRKRAIEYNIFIRLTKDMVGQPQHLDYFQKNILDEIRDKIKT